MIRALAPASKEFLHGKHHLMIATGRIDPCGFVLELRPDRRMGCLLVHNRASGQWPKSALSTNCFLRRVQHHQHARRARSGNRRGAVDGGGDPGGELALEQADVEGIHAVNAARLRAGCDPELRSSSSSQSVPAPT